jgi:DNA/RNA-binding domain of Phe-tRNA-synthetase-like protein
MIPITISQSWKETYPGALVGFLALRAVQNPEQHAVLKERKVALEEQLRARFANTTRSELTAMQPIRAYTDFYKRFKKTYHVLLQLESLVFKKKHIPTVSALVEAMFMAEVKNQMLTAGHDLDIVQTPLQVDVAQGGESFITMGRQTKLLKTGDMYIADQEGILSSVIYGPDFRTRINYDTHSVLFCVYAPPGIQPLAVSQHLEELHSNVMVVAPQASVVLQRVFGG